MDVFIFFGRNGICLVNQAVRSIDLPLSLFFFSIIFNILLGEEMLSKNDGMYVGAAYRPGLGLLFDFALIDYQTRQK